MKAFHSCWTAPFKARNPNSDFNIPPFEILTTVLSALYWQKNNGDIAMICDKTAYDFYKNNNLINLWNDGIQVLLDDIPNEINPHIFWAAGKLFALKNMEKPCVMMDTDFIVWEKLSFDNIKLAAIHPEELVTETYPPEEHFCTDFDFSGLDWTVPAANTAFSFFGDKDFTDYYTSTAIDFILCSKNADNPLTYMVFAEQRLLSMLAKQQNIKLDYFSSLPQLFTSGQTRFTHTWGFKQQMQQNTNIMHDFCKKCANRISKEFPEWTHILSNIDCLLPYF